MYYIGVDLGGTKIAVGLVTEDGKIIYKESIPTHNERNSDLIIKDIADLCRHIIDINKCSISDIRSIGVGSPGTVDKNNGIIIYANNIHFINTPIADMIREHIDIQVYIENDANCAALAENVAGASMGYADSVTITLGTGVGGGVIINKKILSGAFHGGGELGHHVIVVDGVECTCGRRGCWEAYASATGLIRQTKEAAMNDPDSIIMSLVQGDINRIEAKTVFDAADQNDNTAKKVVDKYIHYVAEGLTNIVNIFEPEIIVIGGGVCAQGEKIVGPIRAKVKELIYGGEFYTQITSAILGNDAGIIGAAMLSRD